MAFGCLSIKASGINEIEIYRCINNYLEHISLSLKLQKPKQFPWNIITIGSLVQLLFLAHFAVEI